MARHLRYLGLALVVALVTLAGGARQISADQRDFTLINGSRTSTIVEVYVSPSASDDWEDDVLGQDVLFPGERVNITFGRFNPNTCIYDVKVVTKDGDSSQVTGINLCTTNTVTYRD